MRIRCYQGAPFMPGIFEYQFLPGKNSERDKKLAELIHAYKEAFNSGFRPIFDSGLCEACESCIERCPPAALTMGENDVPQVDLGRCFECAVCATGCPSEAIVMEAKTDFSGTPERYARIGCSPEGQLCQTAPISENYGASKYLMIGSGIFRSF